LVDFVIHRDESVWIDFKGHIWLCYLSS
jgi:hypothetical protein